MESLVLPPKHKLLIKWTLNDPRPYLFAMGGVRTGKTRSATLALLLHSLKFEDTNFILGSQRYQSVEQTSLQYLKEFCEAYDIEFRYKRTAGVAYVGDNRFRLYGGGNSASQDNLQGLTAAGALLDEVVLMNKGFVDQAVARCSIAGSKLLFTGNPGSQFHWFKTEYVDRAEALEAEYMQFTKEDAPFISERVWSQYERTFTGATYQRWIMGEWADDSGLVYPNVQYLSQLPLLKPKMFDLVIDYGTSSVTCALLIGLYGDQWIVCREYYWNAKTNGPRDDAEHAKAIKSLVRPGERLSQLTIDPSAASLRVALAKIGLTTTQGDNSEKIGQQALNVAFQDGNLAVLMDCENTVKELNGLIWDKRAQARGEDKATKGPNHTTDCARYWCMRRFPPRVSNTPINKPVGL